MDYDRVLARTAETKRKKYGLASLTLDELEAYRARGREQAREWRAKNLERSRELNRQATAKRRDKKREYDAVYYAANKQRIIERAVAWRSDRRREWAMKANQTAVRFGVPGKVDWRDLVPEDCAYCGTPCESWDHVMPLSRGGPNTLDNIVPCCWPCNSDKKHRTPEEWFAGERWEQPRRRKKAA